MGLPGRFLNGCLFNYGVISFLADEDRSAIVMLNLLAFSHDGGKERYFEYMRMARPILDRFGAQVLFGGDGLPVLTTGQAKE